MPRSTDKVWPASVAQTADAVISWMSDLTHIHRRI